MGTKWRWDTDFHLGPAFDREASGRADGYNWGIDTFWACANSPTFPHIKVVTYHDDIEHPERLLKAELMVLAATMNSRLGMETLTDHAIVPTMLFSFIGTSVRILIAIHDGSCLRISKSDMMPYSEESDELWSLLMRYLAGGINGEPSTHKLPSVNAAEK
ncbi:uncharacterized protein BO95DRAFT_489360 [Aspergillus brunneoviolaceus CBS 621.78]|uniref:Uncharacterized protein n=1 Tax=Aspergillus brunneoviolaceus CBS 621.78 TaxID=1450534 RepID=A0ACD1GI08_9EURO|nr:hypothetical protein BO95DRAFT_489360 [Aspergillus brunneoviolaceus CBS 621.78]RAH48896.1 hypothetical protein BO95DRAFT_489360 [Aspergillus brunneoviolaceus CBS 621.78]